MTAPSSMISRLKNLQTSSQLLKSSVASPQVVSSAQAATPTSDSTSVEPVSKAPISIASPVQPTLPEKLIEPVVPSVEPVVAAPVEQVTFQDEQPALEQTPSLDEQPTPASENFTPEERLQLFDEALSQAEALPQASESEEAQTMISPVISSDEEQLPQVWEAAQQQAGIASSGRFGKESYAGSSIPEHGSADAGDIQYVEQEKNAEIPVEVESFLQHVEHHEDQLPQEIVVAGSDVQLQPVAYPKQPVIVLPFDENTEKKARFKGPHWSIKWLVEFGRKIMKMFEGKVVYKEAPQQAE